MSANSDPKDNLTDYRDKRSAGGTPEPFGSGSGAGSEGLTGPGVFVIHKHAARRLHYDFRLQMGDVLESWAVPQGASLDPSVKRLAVKVEAHPLEYGDFEGIIPEGNYGAGAVIIWDRGLWIPLEDPVEGMERGKLLFELKGYKLRGTWTLVRTKRPRQTEPGNEWLLIKKADGAADPERVLSEQSVLSGLTIEELREGPQRADEVRAELEELGAPRRDVDVRAMSPMLLETAEGPFDDPKWIFELKYDGYRLMAGVDDHHAYLRYRSGREATWLFPEIAAALEALPYRSFVLDGEIAAFDDEGKPNFNKLQLRAQLHRRAEVSYAKVRNPLTYVIFDLLAFEGHDLRDLPLLERRRLLKEILPEAGPLRFSDHIEGQGVAFFDQVEKLGLEGIVAKRADSRYREMRSADWLKVRVERVDDFAIVGYRVSDKAEREIRSLHLALRDQHGWVYVGRAGSGMSAAELAEMERRLAELPPWKPTFPRPDGGPDVWLEPRYVATVKYSEYSKDGVLRYPVFLHLREDKRPEECQVVPDLADEPPETPPEDRTIVRELRLTNLGKVFWPQEGYTKGDLIQFYRDVSPWLLPYLDDRPVVLTRYPDGIEGKSFFQKDAPQWVPDWIRTERVWSEHSERIIHYFVCDEPDDIAYLVNMGTIPLHIWSSRTASLSRPDWAVIDLDPKEAPFADVIACARGIRTLCTEIELDCYVKTSGSTGLHVLIPLGGQCTYDQARDLTHVISRVVERRLPDISTTVRAPQRREGKVYFDFSPNGHGRLLVAPYSVRPLPGAPVSTPLRWSEVNKKLDPGRFTIKTVLRRLRSQKKDPLLDVLRRKPDFGRSLALLDEVVRGG